MAAHGPHALDRLRNAIEGLEPKYAQDVSIYTHIIEIEKTYSDLLDIERNYNLVSQQTLTNVIHEIQNHPLYNDNVAKVLNTVKANPAIHSILIQTWELAKQASSLVNAIDAILENLSHNLEAGGGCPRGIKARLVQPYLSILYACVEKKEIEKLSEKVERINVTDFSQEELDLAMGLSLSQTPLILSPTKCGFTAKMAADETEREEIALAIALSKSEKLKYT